MTDEINIPDLVRRLADHPRETEWLEFKSSDAKPSELGEYISAIANSATIAGRDCGYIVWGIYDKDHAIIGTTFNPDSKRVKKDDIEHWLSHRLAPDINFQFYRDRVDGKPVVVLVIPKASHHPVRFDGKAYIRVGSHKKKLTDFPEKESSLWSILHKTTFERNIAIQRIKDVEVLRLLDYESYFALMKRPVLQNKTDLLEKLEEEEFIRQRDDGAWDILNLGFLAFARNLASGDLRRKAARIVRYQGVTKSRSRQEELLKGYAAGFGDIIDRVNSLAPVDETFNSGIRKEEPRFPIIAVREMIANALVHQDFTERGRGPLIEIFENCIKVSNPGAPLIEPKRFVNAVPKSRNNKLATLLRRLGICEEVGSGWDKIVEQTEMRHLPAPKIEVFDNSTRITVYAAKPLSEMSVTDRRSAIYLHACLQYEKGDGVTNATVRRRFGMSKKGSSKASRFLTEALVAGDIVPVNPSSSRKFMQYQPYWAGGEEDRH